MGLTYFCNEPRLLALGALRAVETGDALTDDAALRMRMEPLPSTLSIAHDEEQTQVTGDSILSDALRVTMADYSDVFHRLSNNVVNAMKSSSTYIYYLCAILIYNCAYGPWESCLFFRQLLSHGYSVARSLDPDNAALIHFWPRILKDRNHHHESDDVIVGRPSRQNFLHKLHTRSTALLHNQKCSSKTWFSFNTAWASWKEVFHENAFIITNLCITKGWVCE